MNNYEKWLWIELIGFDNEKADLGVDCFLSKLGFIPDGISLLLWNPDIIHSHSDLTGDALLGETQCAYGARPYNEERERQNWTKFQLRKLIGNLKKRNIEVYLSVFDQIMSESWRERANIPKRQEWIDSHQEVLYTIKDGKTASSICPWKRLNDGSLYEDFFLEKLCAVLNDYEADGFHGADGYAHPRFPINTGDFSQDMLEQFETFSSLAVPRASTAIQAEWILGNARKEWLDFHSLRHQQFWKKAVTALRSVNKKLILNTTWTRDPFEAKYRYGVDYKMLTDIGVNVFIVEAPAAVVELEGWNKTTYNTLDKFMCMIMRLKAYLPGVKFILLNCIKDNMEQYNILRHAPSMLESDVFSMANVFCNSPSLQRCLSGIMACLADGISQSEWTMVEKTWNIGFSESPESPESISGASVIWSDKALANELNSYISNSLCSSSYQLHYKLLSLGAPLMNIANIKDINSLHGCILVTNPCFFPEDELVMILDYRNGPVVLAGAGLDDDCICSVYNCGKEVWRNNSSKLQASSKSEVSSWLDELPDATLSDDFIATVSTIIKQYSGTELLNRNSTDVKVWSFTANSDSKLLFARNDKNIYKSVKISLMENISSVKILTGYPCLPVSFIGKEMEFKIPPKCTVILNIKLKHQE